MEAPRNLAAGHPSWCRIGEDGVMAMLEQPPGDGRTALYR